MSGSTAATSDGNRHEQSRYVFLANATLGIGGIIGLVLSVPLVGSLVPSSLLNGDDGKGVWTDIPPSQFLQLKSALVDPVAISISFEHADGYFPPARDERFVWGIALDKEGRDAFIAARPELFTRGAASVGYPAITAGFVIFSPICPHLGCSVKWHADARHFVCPCHGSTYEFDGRKISGPAPRGLDPLPLREKDGIAQVTWIQYKASEPDRVIVAFG